MRKKYTIILMVMLLVFSNCSCSKENDVIEEAYYKGANSEILEKGFHYDDHDGKVLSKLTGEYVKPTVANTRPVCMMINNIDVAMPQSGISNADIMYECLVEGGITRLMAVFQNYKKLKKIGPVRSARHYYVDFADEYGGIYAHFGQTKYAVKEMEDLKIDTISGLSSIGTVAYYRDSSRVAPHNAYATGKGISNAIKKLKYDNNLYIEDRFEFSQDPVTLDGAKPAAKVNLKFNAYSSPWFEYNEKTKEYLRFQYKKKHIDDLTGKQLSYKNIIVQFVKEWDIDKKGYQTMDNVGSGKGYYITEGNYIPICWRKNSKGEMTVYTKEDGTNLTVNKGKTWICVFPKDRAKNVTIE